MQFSQRIEGRGKDALVIRVERHRERCFQMPSCSRQIRLSMGPLAHSPERYRNAVRIADLPSDRKAFIYVRLHVFKTTHQGTEHDGSSERAAADEASLRCAEPHQHVRGHPVPELKRATM